MPKDKIDTEANEVLKTQIDASMGIARSIVSSWLPPPKPGEKLEDDEDDEETYKRYSTGRPDRLGLGAKYLSHAEAMNNATGGAMSKQELELKNKILNQNRRAAFAKDDARSTSKRSKGNEGDDDDDDDEEDSRTTTASKKKKNKFSEPTPEQDARPTKDKKIGGQGDFLSMYLNERAAKKKKKQKKV